MSGSWIKDYWAIIVTSAALVGFAYVANYRLVAVETQLERVDLKDMSRTVTALKCEVKNIKRVLQQKPEIDCD